MYYTYAYLREDRTPYYIGKGKGRRAYSLNHRINLPPKDRILILKEFANEYDALRHEIYMIAVLGRKDLGTGMLQNLSSCCPLCRIMYPEFPYGTAAYSPLLIRNPSFICNTFKKIGVFVCDE